MDKLQQAVISLIETQTKLAERQVDTDKRWFEVKEDQVKIREELNQVIKILQEHTVLLQRMPQAVKEQVGFRAS